MGQLSGSGDKPIHSVVTSTDPSVMAAAIAELQAELLRARREAQAQEARADAAEIRADSAEKRADAAGKRATTLEAELAKRSEPVSSSPLYNDVAAAAESGFPLAEVTAAMAVADHAAYKSDQASAEKARDASDALIRSVLAATAADESDKKSEALQASIRVERAQFSETISDLKSQLSEQVEALNLALEAVETAHSEAGGLTATLIKLEADYGETQRQVSALSDRLSHMDSETSAIVHDRDRLNVALNLEKANVALLERRAEALTKELANAKKGIQAVYQANARISAHRSKNIRERNLAWKQVDVAKAVIATLKTEVTQVRDASVDTALKMNVAAATIQRVFRGHQGRGQAWNRQEAYLTLKAEAMFVAHATSILSEKLLPAALMRATDSQHLRLKKALVQRELVANFEADSVLLPLSVFEQSDTIRCHMSTALLAHTEKLDSALAEFHAQAHMPRASGVLAAQSAAFKSVLDAVNSLDAAAHEAVHAVSPTMIPG